MLTAISIWLYIGLSGSVYKCFQQQLPSFQQEIVFKLFFIFISVSLLSLWMLPIPEIAQTFSLWGTVAFAENALTATPDSIFYPLAALNRMFLFVVFASLLAIGPYPLERYRMVLLGLSVGTVLVSLIGIFNYHGIMSLMSLRDLDPIENPSNNMLRLQSTFGHPGWFAEYATTTLPLLLIGVEVFKRKKAFILKIALLAAFMVCEYAILQSKARGGWIANIFTIMSGVLIWVWIKYDLKSAAIQFINQRYRKIYFFIFISVVTVIILGVKLIYTIEDYAQQIEDTHKPLSRIDRSQLKNRFLLMLNPNERLHLWKQGIAAGLEAPFFGMGYETYAWHKKILKQQNGSYFHTWKLFEPDLDTPHNFYIQHFTNNGILGLMLWIGILFFILKKHWSQKAIREVDTALPTFLAIINFHIYGIFQSMNYVPVVWLLIFILYGHGIVITYTGRKRTVARCAQS